ncbi:hypothetical protein [Streptomyces sp. NBC_01304]|uniref:hypothetical protein n=1 Tax=Streptomyces sp. NBC_01304 TaxID=2903818 RepID=UPI002E0F4E21|nr:hypothetical protein OG430_20830 [Streptomyces sp. NBC_01304]
MSVRRRVFGRRRAGAGSGGGSGAGERESAEFAQRVCSELALDLPDEDVAEDLDDCLDMYEMGSKPRCEEVEYLRLVSDARDRIAHGG